MSYYPFTAMATASFYDKTKDGCVTVRGYMLVGVNQDNFNQLNQRETGPLRGARL